MPSRIFSASVSLLTPQSLFAILWQNTSPAEFKEKITGFLELVEHSPTLQDCSLLFKDGFVHIFSLLASFNVLTAVGNSRG